MVVMVAMRVAMVDCCVDFDGGGDGVVIVGVEGCGSDVDLVGSTKTNVLDVPTVTRE